MLTVQVIGVLHDHIISIVQSSHDSANPLQPVAMPCVSGLFQGYLQALSSEHQAVQSVAMDTEGTLAAANQSKKSFFLATCLGVGGGGGLRERDVGQGKGM